MDINEANRICAEFMGVQVTTDGIPFEVDQYYDSQGDLQLEQIPLQPYSESLDSLVSVWEKLMQLDGFRFSNRLTIFKDICISDISMGNCMCLLEQAKTIQAAAAIATARAIQELEKEN